MITTNDFFDQAPTQNAVMSHWQRRDVPFVSVLVLTYNQIEYLPQTLLTILQQRSPYSFEIVINDDCSTDETQAFLTRAQASYPELIKLNLQTQNQHSLGKKNLPTLLGIARGEYYAVCDGDDYWCDDFKLAKQIQAMEQEPSVLLSFHGCKQLNTANNSFLDDYRPPARKAYYGVADFLIHGGNLSPSAACIYRASFFDTLPEWVWSAPVLDVVLETLAADAHQTMTGGGVLYIDEVMSVYRVLAKGSWNARPVDKIKSEHQSYLDTMTRLGNALSQQHQKHIKGALSRRPSFDAHRCLMNQDGPATRYFLKGELGLSKLGLKSLVLYILSFVPGLYRQLRIAIGKPVIS